MDKKEFKNKYKKEIESLTKGYLETKKLVERFNTLERELNMLRDYWKNSESNDYALYNKIFCKLKTQKEKDIFDKIDEELIDKHNDLNILVCIEHSYMGSDDKTSKYLKKFKRESQ